MMMRVTILFTILLLSAGAIAHAQSDEAIMRFEIAGGAGFPTVLSGPDLQDQTNLVARLGWFPSKNFMLTLTYDRWETNIAPDDILNSHFAEIYRQSVASNINFNEALLKDSTCDIDQYELGLVKAIPLGESKHWETYIGIGVGLQNATAQVQWEGATRRILQGPNTGQTVPFDAVLPEELSEDNDEIFVSVRGGMHWLPVSWFGLEGDLRIVPINSVFDQSLNTLELNFGLLFRFGKF